MELVSSFIIVYFLYETRHFLDTESKRIDAEQLTSADFAVKVDGLPPDAGDADLADRLTDAFELALQGPRTSFSAARARTGLPTLEVETPLGPIAHIGVSRGCRESVVVCERRAEALETLRAARGGLTAQEGTAAEPTLKAEVARLEKEVDELTGTLRELAGRPGAQRCSGTAFVSFRDSHAAVRLLELQAAAGSGSVVRLPGKSVKTTYPIYLSRPPEPEDIVWANLPVSTAERSWRQALGTLLMLVIALSGTVVITVAQA
jgi:hypothetical protein